jgi:hypothetical protein
LFTVVYKINAVRKSILRILRFTLVVVVVVVVVVVMLDRMQCLVFTQTVTYVKIEYAIQFLILPKHGFSTSHVVRKIHANTLSGPVLWIFHYVNGVTSGSVIFITGAVSIH